MPKKEVKIYFNDYEILDSDINKASLIVLRNKSTGSLCIQKILTDYDLDVYKTLKAHPVNNTPRIIDYIETETSLILLKEYIIGITLDEFLQNEGFSKPLFFKHMYKLCDIINDFQNLKNTTNNNERSIIHRDIKPSNIIISNNNELYLFDLNAAKFYKENESRDTKLLGTENFAAPEQYGFGPSNRSTDIYAIGKLIEQYVNHSNDKDFIKDMTRIINNCCEMDYKNRYKNVFELKTDLFRAEHRLMNLVIPGFRHLNFLNMVLATLFYSILIFVCFIHTYYDRPLLNTLIFIAAFSFILVFFNYLDVLRFFPITKSKNLLIKYLSRFIVSLVIPAVIFAISIYVLNF